MLEGARPFARHRGRPAHDQLHGSIARIPIAHHFANAAVFRPVRLNPLIDAGVPIGIALNQRAGDLHAQIVPAIFRRRGEIVVGNVEPARHHTCVIGDTHLLVVADQETLGILRLETGEGSARIAKRLEERWLGAAAECIDIEPDLYPTLRCLRQGIADLRTGIVLGILEVETVECFLRRFDDFDQRLDPVLAARVEGEMMTVRLDLERFGITIVGGLRRIARSSGWRIHTLSSQVQCMVAIP